MNQPRETGPADAPALQGQLVVLVTPTDAELADLKATLVSQLPEVARTWWPRVVKARKEADGITLKLLHAEAKNRLDHNGRKQGEAVLRVLFRALGVVFG